MHKTFAAGMALLWLGACATEFRGAPKVKDGPAGCRRTCDEWKMELVGMVKMGEYSDGCICQARGAAPGSATPGAPRSEAGPSGGELAGQPAIAGVYIQMQQAAAAAAGAAQARAQSGSTEHREAGQPAGSRPGIPAGHR